MKLCVIIDRIFVFPTTGNVRLSDLGLAVELKEGKTMTKGYAGTPGESLLNRDDEMFVNS